MRASDASALAPAPATRGRAIRAVELAGLAGSAALLALLVARLVPHAAASPLLFAGACVAGWLAADLVTGFFHWLADRFGSPSTPVVGPALVRAFREHHADPRAITRRDFVETNGTNCAVSLPGLLAALALPASGDAWLGAGAFLGSLACACAATNQLHQWAHAERPPAAVRALQRLRVCLPPEHHARHHVPPHSTHYCVTSGWLNAPLDALGVFAALEAAIRRAARRRRA
jgi:ubiquitin-conjugating enzyme E2 variant